MQHDQKNSVKSSARSRLGRRTRFVELNQTQHAGGMPVTTGDLYADKSRSNTSPLGSNTQKRAALTTSEHESIPLRQRSTAHLMQLSGMLRPLATVDAPSLDGDGYWPLGIQQIGPFPLIHLYGREPLGQTLPSAVPLVTPANPRAPRPTWQRVLTSPACRIVYGLLIGLALLFLTALFVQLPATFALLQIHLLSPSGIGLALLAGLAFLVAQALRGLRWKLFLNPVGQISVPRSIELACVALLLNFALPVRSGEAAKSLALKRLEGVPISKSLPTIAVDKTLDFVLALLPLALVPLLGVHMSPQLWVVFSVACMVLVGLLALSALLAWRRARALNLVRALLCWLPRTLSSKVEGYITGFADALLIGVSSSRIFFPALLLSILALLCDGLFLLFAFWSIGTTLSPGLALFGATLCAVLALLPSPPGQFGSHEILGLLVFSALLGLPTNAVAAMYIFSHLWVALLTAGAGLVGLFALNLGLTGALHTENH